MKRITLPLTHETIKSLKAGERVLISGGVFTARDAAHKRLIELIGSGSPLPVEIAGQTVYYAGPCPAPPGQIIGSCGPTTAGRCDAYTAPLLRRGLKGMIGKGARSQEIISQIKKHEAVYFAAIGGAGAFYASCVKEARVIAFPELGAEAVYMLTVEDFPAIVAIDSGGNCIFNNAEQDFFP